jgi:hypothetical protein
MNAIIARSTRRPCVRGAALASAVLASLLGMSVGAGVRQAQPSTPPSTQPSEQSSGAPAQTPRREGGAGQSGETPGGDRPVYLQAAGQPGEPSARQRSPERDGQGPRESNNGPGGGQNNGPGGGPNGGLPGGAFLGRDGLPRPRRSEPVDEEKLAQALVWAKKELPNTLGMYERTKAPRLRFFLRGVIIGYFERVEDGKREAPDLASAYQRECRNMDELIGLTREYARPQDDRKREAVLGQMRDKMQAIAVARLDERRHRLNSLRARLEMQERALQTEQERLANAVDEHLNEVISRMVRGLEDEPPRGNEAPTGSTSAPATQPTDGPK